MSAIYKGEGKVVMLIGDVNCDLLKPCCYTKTLQEMCGKYHLRQLIKDPTRITEDSETLVDHVNTSNRDKIVSSGVIHTGLSDHSMVYASWGRAVKLTRNFHKYRVNRNDKKFDSEEFLKDLDNVQWCQVTNLNDVKEALARFEYLFLQICNKHVPLRKKRVRKQTSPWLTTSIVKMMHERDYIKKKANLFLLVPKSYGKSTKN